MRLEQCLFVVEERKVLVWNKSGRNAQWGYIDVVWVQISMIFRNNVFMTQDQNKVQRKIRSRNTLLLCSSRFLLVFIFLTKSYFTPYILAQVSVLSSPYIFKTGLLLQFNVFEGNYGFIYDALPTQCVSIWRAGNGTKISTIFLLHLIEQPTDSAF